MFIDRYITRVCARERLPGNLLATAQKFPGTDLLEVSEKDHFANRSWPRALHITASGGDGLG